MCVWPSVHIYCPYCFLGLHIIENTSTLMGMLASLIHVINYFLLGQTPTAPLGIRPIFSLLTYDHRQTCMCTLICLLNTGTVREMLGLHPYEIVEVNPSQHSDYLVLEDAQSLDQYTCTYNFVTALINRNVPCSIHHWNGNQYYWGNARHLLLLQCDNPPLQLFFESPSRNKVLKANTQ